MRSFTFVTDLLLCSLSWISVSASESHTVEVQSGGDVTLMCSNISKTPTQTEWFRSIKRTKPSCVSSMNQSDSKALFCDGFQNRFEMSSNISTVFLQIKRVELSDSGLWFCGFYMDGHTVISNAIYLKVQGDGESDFGVDLNTERKVLLFSIMQVTRETIISVSTMFLKTDSNSVLCLVEESDGTTKVKNVILGALIVLTVFLTIVVNHLAVKIKRLQKAVNEELQPERNQDLGSDELNYAALNFKAQPERSRRPASERELDPHVVYAVC
ncbi:uncharacterized protein LOC117935233 [Etheostoma cragini]|uniref:uncharacterized protein LOC117935233 n=1 Tax=Etheostoma cragini TaxID=417921 RepID=UPI00155E4277|nr:uncharacterized protein LOC117935233 [Etheostoma cragini]